MKADGRSAWIVTSKPAPHAERAASLLGIADLVDGITAASLSETDTKAELVATALSRSGASPARTVMLGDRSYDVAGALANDVTPVGALWGYGSRDELWDAGCRNFARSASEFEGRYIRPQILAAD